MPDLLQSVKDIKQKGLTILKKYVIIKTDKFLKGIKNAR